MSRSTPALLQLRVLLLLACVTFGSHLVSATTPTGQAYASNGCPCIDTDECTSTPPVPKGLRGIEGKGWCTIDRACAATASTCAASGWTRPDTLPLTPPVSPVVTVSEETVEANGALWGRCDVAATVSSVVKVDTPGSGSEANGAVTEQAATALRRLDEYTIYCYTENEMVGIVMGYLILIAIIVVLLLFLFCLPCLMSCCGCCCCCCAGWRTQTIVVAPAAQPTIVNNNNVVTTTTH